MRERKIRKDKNKKKFELEKNILFALVFCLEQIIKKACLTQLAEYRFCKPNVIGSTPIAGLT